MGEAVAVFFLFVIIGVCIIVKGIYDFSFLFYNEIKLSKFHKIIAFFVAIIFSYFYFPSIYTLSLTSELKFDPNTEPVDTMAYIWWFYFLIGAVLLGVKKSGLVIIIVRNVWLMILFICPILLFMLFNSTEKYNVLFLFQPWWDKYLLLSDQQDIVKKLFDMKLNERDGVVLTFLCYQMVVFIIFIITKNVYIRK